jgi:hypothetical protein
MMMRGPNASSIIVPKVSVASMVRREGLAWLPDVE